MAVITYTRSRTAMREYGDLVVKRIKRQLKIDRTHASGATHRSVKGNLKNIKGNYIDYAISADATLNLIDKGRGRGKKPPRWEDIKKWMEDKGVRPKNNKGRYVKVSELNMKRSAMGIAQSIGRKGTIKRFGYKGSNILEFSIKSVQAKGVAKILNAWEEDTNSYIKKTAKQ